MPVISLFKFAILDPGFTASPKRIIFWRLFQLCGFIVSSGLLFGCSSMLSESHQSSAFRNKNSNKTLDALSQQYGNWKSVKYKMGGLSKRGVDCSGFVYLTFQEKLGVKIPRTTKLQYASSKKINKKELRTGDLVFFKTGIKQKHVGIYLTKMQFLHASTSKGVTVSDMNNPYWKKHFLSARRI